MCRILGITSESHEAIICFDKTIEINKKSMVPAAMLVAGPNLDPSPFANKALTLLGQRKY